MYKISYITDGTATEFAFTFPFFQASDVRVLINDVLDSAEYNYSVIPNSDFSGGTVVFDIAPIAETKLDIVRQITLSRTIDYQPTRTIDPEDLNTDFNFLLSAFQDLHSVSIDLIEWQNRHDDIKSLMNYTIDMISDRVSGGGTLGLYRNLLAVLENALPNLISDFGDLGTGTTTDGRDDYGVL